MKLCLFYRTKKGRLWSLRQRWVKWRWVVVILPWQCVASASVLCKRRIFISSPVLPRSLRSLSRIFWWPRPICRLLWWW